MVAVVSEDRLNAAWTRLVRWAVGFLAVKSVDACALYFGRVVAINGAKVDVQLDTAAIPSPSGVPLYLGFPASSVEGIENSRVLVGFRNGDISQPYAIAFEFNATATLVSIGNSSPKEAARKGDAISHGTIAFVAAGSTSITSLTITYTPGDGGAQQVISLTPAGTGALTIGEKIAAGSSSVKIGD